MVGTGVAGTLSFFGLSTYPLRKNDSCQPPSLGTEVGSHGILLADDYTMAASSIEAPPTKSTFEAVGRGIIQSTQKLNDLQPAAQLVLTRCKVDISRL